MNLRQRIFISLTIAWGMTTASFAQYNVDGIAALVNNDVITFSDVKKRVEDTEKSLVASGLEGTELTDRIREVRLDALRALIDRQLILQEFNNKGFFMPDHPIEERINEIVREKFDGDRSAFNKTLKSLGKTLEQFKKEQREEIIVGYMRHKFIAEQVVVSPYKIEQYYQENIKEFAVPEQVKLRVIFLNHDLFKEKKTLPDGQEIEVDRQKQLAEEILSKLDAGADFSEMARNYSEGPSKDEGGDLGWITHDTLRKELTDIAFKLFPGQHSRVIDTEDGFYIIKSDDHKEASVRSLEEARGDIEKLLTTEERRKVEEEWLNRLKARAYIKMF